MKLNKRNLSGREKNPASIVLLEQLREQLFREDISKARRAAHNLSWMQEDGLDILKEALYSNFPRSTKIAAAYGLRNMNGRMKKKALAVLEQGLWYRNSDTKNVCQKALLFLKTGVSESSACRDKAKLGRFGIKEVFQTGNKKRLKEKSVDIRDKIEP